MNISSSQFKPTISQQTKLYQEETTTESATFSRSDSIDLTDPAELLPAVGMFGVGAIPFVGTVTNGVKIFDGETKAQRWAALAAAGASLVGLPLLLAGVTTGDATQTAAGALLTAVAGGNQFYHHAYA